MKSNKDFRGNGQHADPDNLRRGTKLPPMKKSGKQKHNLYNNYEDEDDEELSFGDRKRESIFDYLDDGEEDL